MRSLYAKVAYVVAGWFVYNFLLILALEPLETFTLMFHKVEWFCGTFRCMASHPVFVIVNLLYLGWAATLFWAELRDRRPRPPDRSAG